MRNFLSGMMATILVVGIAASGMAQEADPAVQKSAIIAALAQQLTRAEAANQAYQSQLAQEQKKIADLTAKCGDPCKAEPAK